MMKFEVGNWVQDNKDRIGVVYKTYRNFSKTGENEDWLKAQRSPGDPNEPWVSIIIINGGAILMPESQVSHLKVFWSAVSDKSCDAITKAAITMIKRFG